MALQGTKRIMMKRMIEMVGKGSRELNRWIGPFFCFKNLEFKHETVSLSGWWLVLVGPRLNCLLSFGYARICKPIWISEHFAKISSYLALVLTLCYFHMWVVLEFKLLDLSMSLYGSMLTQLDPKGEVVPWGNNTYSATYIFIHESSQQ